MIEDSALFEVVFSCYGQPYFLVIVRGLLLCPQIKKATLGRYDKDVELRYHSMRAYYKSAQVLVQILVVLYPDRIELTLFLFTDPHQTPEGILKLIATRFKIEVTFQYLKEQGGLTHWQCRKERAVTRSATLKYLCP